MPAIDFHLLPLPKGAPGSRGAGFVGDAPAGEYTSKKGHTFLVTADRHILLRKPERVPVAEPGQLWPGVSWTGKRGAAEAACWVLNGAEAPGHILSSAGYTSTSATAADGDVVVGCGDQPGEAPSRALMWKEWGPPVALLDPSAPERSAIALAVRGDLVGGRTGGLHAHAGIWRGTSDAFVDLHVAGRVSSCVRGLGDGEQVGDTSIELSLGDERRPALWRGSADTFVDLTPDGFAYGAAVASAGGFQAGWVRADARQILTRARLWRGSAADSTDLHPGEAWTASMVLAARVVNGKLLLVGTVERRRPGTIVLEAEQACWWEVDAR